MELGIAVRAHIGDVDIADAPLGGLVHPLAVGLDPLAIARRALAAQCLDRQHTRRAAIGWGDRQQHLGRGLVDQQLLRRKRAPDAPPADRQQPIAGLDVHAGASQRRAGLLIPDIALDDPPDSVAIGLAVVVQVGPQEALVVARPWAMVAAAHIGVRGAQLALHLQHQIGELGARRHPIQQRQIALVDRQPVDARHIGGPELIALEAPGLAIHLLPFSAGLNRDPDTLEVDPAASTAWRAIILGLLASLEHPQAVSGLVDQRAGILRDRKDRHAVDQRLDAALGQVIDLDLALRAIVAGLLTAKRALDRERREQHLTLDAAHPPVATLGHREGHQPVGDPFEIDPQRLFRSILFIASIGASLLVLGFLTGLLLCLAVFWPSLLLSSLSGPNGEGVSAWSVTKKGRSPRGKLNSKWMLSRTGLKSRHDIK